MPAKKKTLAKKLKVELKDLKPRKDAKGGAGYTEVTCAHSPVIAPKYCSGPVM